MKLQRKAERVAIPRRRIVGARRTVASDRFVLTHDLLAQRCEREALSAGAPRGITSVDPGPAQVPDRSRFGAATALARQRCQAVVDPR